MHMLYRVLPAAAFISLISMFNLKNDNLKNDNLKKIIHSAIILLQYYVYIQINNTELFLAQMNDIAHTKIFMEMLATYTIAQILATQKWGNIIDKAKEHINPKSCAILLANITAAFYGYNPLQLATNIQPNFSLPDITATIMYPVLAAIGMLIVYKYTSKKQSDIGSIDSIIYPALAFASLVIIAAVCFAFAMLALSHPMSIMFNIITSFVYYAPSVLLACFTQLYNIMDINMWINVTLVSSLIKMITSNNIAEDIANYANNDLKSEHTIERPAIAYILCSMIPRLLNYFKETTNIISILLFQNSPLNFASQLISKMLQPIYSICSPLPLAVIALTILISISLYKHIHNQEHNIINESINLCKNIPNSPISQILICSAIAMYITPASAVLNTLSIVAKPVFLMSITIMINLAISQLKNEKSPPIDISKKTMSDILAFYGATYSSPWLFVSALAVDNIPNNIPNSILNNISIA